MSPSGDYLYAGALGLLVFRRDVASGKLSFVQNHDATTSSLPDAESIVVSPDGTFVYATDDNSTATVVSFEREAICASSPLAGCQEAAKGVLKVNKTNDLKAKVVSKWVGSAPFDAGDPVLSTDVALCMYDASGSSQPRLGMAAAAGGTCGPKDCWKSSTTGFTYTDKLLTPDGLVKLKLKTGIIGTPKITAKAKGGSIPPFALPLTFPATVQLQVSNGECLEATFSSAVVNTAAKLTAKLP